MNGFIAKSLLILSLALIMTGCKVAVIVVQGGKVQSDSPDCLAGNVCIHEVTNTSYTESFEAVPDPGWHFVKWNSGDDFFCKDSKNPTCVVSNVLVAGNPVANAVVATDTTYYIMPIFDEGPDTVNINGREWAQPDLFLGLSWNEINAVCPSGTCIGTLTANSVSYNMVGWTWASVDGVNSLFNYFLENAGRTGSQLLSGPDYLLEDHAHWADDVFAAGFRPTSVAPSLGGELVDKKLKGWSSELYFEGALVPRAEYYPWYGAEGGRNTFSTSGTRERESISREHGAWFYRTP